MCVHPQVCSDGESLCSSQSECSVCGSDGSAVVFTATDPQRTYEYLEVGAPQPLAGDGSHADVMWCRCVYQVNNFDAWVQDAGGCVRAASHNHIASSQP